MWSPRLNGKYPQPSCVYSWILGGYAQRSCVYTNVVRKQMKKISAIIIGLIIFAACGKRDTVDYSALTCTDLNKGLENNLTKLSDFRDLGPENLSYLDDSLPKVNQEIISLLKQIPTNKGLQNCDLDFDMATYISSDDRRLRFMSWDTKQGGTMIDFATVAIFQDKDSLKVKLLLTEFGENLFENFYEIYTIQDNRSEALYLVKAYGIGSTLVRQLSVKVFQVKNGLTQVAIFPNGQNEITLGYETSSQDTLFDIKVLEQGKKLLIPIVDGDSLTGDYDELNFNGATFASAQQQL